MKIGSLIHRVAIEQWQDSPEDFSGVKRTYTHLQDVWGELKPLKGGRVWGSQQIEELATHLLTIRWQQRLIVQADSYRISFEGRHFRILNAENVGERNEYLVIRLEETNHD